MNAAGNVKYDRKFMFSVLLLTFCTELVSLLNSRLKYEAYRRVEFGDAWAHQNRNLVFFESTRIAACTFYLRN